MYFHTHTLHVYHMHVGACRDQKRALGPLELELTAFLSCPSVGPLEEQQEPTSASERVG